jgi:hypothetical protein
VQDEADAERTLGWRVLGAVPAEAGSGAAAAGIAVPALGGLLPRSWRKPAATLALLIGLGTLTALAARVLSGLAA